MKNKKWLWNGLRIGAGFTILGFLFLTVDIPEFLEIIRKANLPLFLTTLISYILIQIIFSYRWQLLLKVFQLFIPIIKLLKAYLIGLFWTNLIPTAIGGDVARGYYMYRYTQKGKEVAISVIVERFTGFTAQVLIGLVALAFIFSSLPDPLIAWVILGTTLVYIISLIILFNQTVFILSERFLKKIKAERLGQMVLKIYDAISLYKSAPNVLFQTVFISLIVQAITIVIYYVLSLSLHISIPLFYFFLFLPIINIISMIPITPGGFGLREGISVTLFSTIGVSQAHALGLSLAWFLVIVLTSLIGGVLYFQKGPRPPSSLSPSER